MIGIIFCNDLNTCPYIDKYFQVLDAKGVDYEVVIWNRDGKNVSFPENFVVFDERSDIHVARWKKVGAFFRFRKFLIKTIKERKYDKLIMLTTIPAVLCSSLLLGEYKGRYIFDFRDLSYERFGFYRKEVKKIAENASFTCISSPAFAEAIGIESYVMAHNFRYSDIEKEADAPVLDGDVIELLHIGITRGEDYNKRLADIFGNDSRFRVNIIGSGNDTPTFLEYVKDINNFTVMGRYNNEDKKKYIDSASMLLYYYPCDFNCNRALANKYYDGMIYKKPLIGNINTYSGKRLCKMGLGISLSLDDEHFADKIYDYVRSLDIKAYLAAVDTEKNAVLAEDKIYLDRIASFLEE